MSSDLTGDVVTDAWAGVGERLGARSDAIMREYGVPGAAVALVEAGEVVYARGFGATGADAAGRPVNSRTLFRIGSVAKPLTGTAILRLVEAGVLDLDRPVGEYVGGLRFSDPSASQRITLRMLLSHTSGLPRDLHPVGRRGVEVFVREQVPRYPLVAPPGRLYCYSNAGMALAGYVAAVATGRPFADLMREWLFVPLGMERTVYDPAVAMTLETALGHEPGPDGVPRPAQPLEDNPAYYPAGYAYSTVLDLARFAALHLGRGWLDGQQLLAHESVAAMWTPHARTYLAPTDTYGLTFKISERQGAWCVSHDGNLGPFGCQLTLVPDRELACIVMVNRFAGLAPLAEAALSALLERPIASGFAAVPEWAQTVDRVKTDPLETTRETDQYEGTYLGYRTGLAVIRREGSELALTLNGDSIPFHPWGPDLYRGRRQDADDAVTVGFVPEPTGLVRYILVDGSPCERHTPEPGDWSEVANWEPHAGVYRGEADPETVTLRVRDGTLLLDVPKNGMGIPCAPVGRGRFACRLGVGELRVPEDGGPPLLRLVGAYTYERMGNGH